MNSTIYTETTADPSRDLHCRCLDCGSDHHLPAGESIALCMELMRWLGTHQRIDYLCQSLSNSLFSTDNLFGTARGKMFGVLQGIDTTGKKRAVYAFSGQFNGLWNVPGWAPPVFNETNWNNTNTAAEKKIKLMSEEIALLDPQSEERKTLCRQRKKLSQVLMKKLHSLYIINSFNGQQLQLSAFFPTKNGIPTGTGDCCAPKLLNHARQLNITPIGISEFYWGKENKSGTKKHGCFYAPCEDKCMPMLGFMLCGLENTRTN